MWHEIYPKKFRPTWAEFSEVTSRQVGEKFETDFRPTWSEVQKLTSVQRGQKSEIQLRHNLCRNQNHFYAICVEVRRSNLYTMCVEVKNEHILIFEKRV